MERLFKALSDDTRRLILDRLRERDGQTLSELETVSGMTRFGIMKHLRVLEAAHLVLTRKVGRCKYHYLNVAPLQAMVDRWIEPFTRQAAARSLLDLKASIEAQTQDRILAMATNASKPGFVLETFIRATPEQVWGALTSPELSPKYMFMQGAYHSTLQPGAPYEYRTPDGKVPVHGQIIAVDAPHRLEQTWQAGWMAPDAEPHRVVFEIEAVGALTKLTVLHFGLLPGQEGLKEAWAQITSSLKSLLETGEGFLLMPH
jgi:uncharacterized protein YndB with AHSA1/START domain/DNA-binding transcriptional ArsR family regulator